jgi:hypothetical protein
MPKFKEDDRPIYFWYSNADKLANSLQSTYLWAYSRVMDSNEGTQGLPFLNGVKIDLLRKRCFLVLFDRDWKIVNQGIEAVRQLGLQFAVRRGREICEEDICYSIVVLDVTGDVRKVENTQ